MDRLTKRISDIIIWGGVLGWLICSRSIFPALSLLAVFLHEIGHIIGAAFCGVTIPGFRLFTSEARLTISKILSYEKEVVICLLGPAFNLLSVFAALLHGGKLLGDDAWSFFATVSAALSLLNLLPLADLDGGRICYCLFARFIGTRAATVITAVSSFFTLFCLWSISVYILLRTDGSPSLFLFSASLFWRLFSKK